MQLTVYDLTGSEIVQLAHGQYQVGYHYVTWNGKTAENREAPSGIYFCRLMTSEYANTIKLVLLR